MLIFFSIYRSKWSRHWCHWRCKRSNCEFSTLCKSVIICDIFANFRL